MKHQTNTNNAAIQSSLHPPDVMKVLRFRFDFLGLEPLIANIGPDDSFKFSHFTAQKIVIVQRFPQNYTFNVIMSTPHL